jgi:hypothetical protein
MDSEIKQMRQQKITTVMLTYMHPALATKAAVLARVPGAFSLSIVRRQNALGTHPHISNQQSTSGNTPGFDAETERQSAF